MIRRPPRSTLFPYTSSSDLDDAADHREEDDRDDADQADQAERQTFPVRRSEEHTSELQSHSDLVCRLLLEKKKTDQSATAVIYVDRKSDQKLRVALYDSSWR